MYRAICGTYVNSSPAGGPSSHPTPGRGEGVPCTPQANALVPAATSAGSYSVPTSRVRRKFTARAASAGAEDPRQDRGPGGTAGAAGIQPAWQSGRGGGPGTTGTPAGERTRTSARGPRGAGGGGRPTPGYQRPAPGRPGPAGEQTRTLARGPSGSRRPGPARNNRSGTEAAERAAHRSTRRTAGWPGVRVGGKEPVSANNTARQPHGPLTTGPRNHRPR